jgi:hypothetical protein
MLRGRVKLYRSDKGFGFLEVPGHPDHFFHVNQHKRVLVDAGGISFGVLATLDAQDHPQEGDWLVFESSQLRDREQPQAMPWCYGDEFESAFRPLAAVFCEGLRLLGLAK